MSVRRALALFTSSAVLMGLAVAGPQAAAAAAEPSPSPGPAGVAELVPAVAGEVTSLRTQTSRTVRRADGLLEATLSSRSLHYRSLQGQWLPIDNELVRDDGRLRNKANRFSAEFAAESDGEFQKVTVGGVEFNWSLPAAAKVAASSAGQSVTYPRVLPGVDLTYDVTADAVKETLVLASPLAQTDYAFRLTSPTPGVRAERHSDGSWLFFGPPATEPLFRLLAPVAYDAAGRGPGETPNATLTVQESAGGFDVGLSLDREWLTQPGRQFPVELDPTTFIEGTTDTRDAYFNTACPTCTGVRTDRLAIGTGDTEVFRSALRFAVGTVIPAGSAVRTAELTLAYDKQCIPVSAVSTPLGTRPGDTALNPCGSDSQHTLFAHELAAPWTTTGRSSSLQVGEYQSAFTLPNDALGGTARPMSWDLTRLTKAWYAGTKTNNGLILLKSGDSELKKSGPRPPSSRATSSAPYLTVVYGLTVSVLPFDTLRPDGAEVAWTEYPADTPDAFAAYEVLRDGRQLAVITERTTTRFRDTTAGPGRRNYTVRVRKAVGGEDDSQPAPVTLPAANTVKTIALAPSTGAATQITQQLGPDGQPAPSCANFGASRRLQIGRTPTSLSRALIKFDLGDVPADAQLLRADLELSAFGTAGTAVTARPATALWEEGTGDAQCTGDGATWKDRAGDAVTWAAPGGDADGAALAVPFSGLSSTVSVLGQVGEWVRGARPVHGLLLSAADEAAQGTTVLGSDDETDAPHTRPTLKLEYLEPALKPGGPAVQLLAPRPNATLTGQVRLSALALDDADVDHVRFILKRDGDPDRQVGLDYTKPYEVSFDSRAVANSCPAALDVFPNRAAASPESAQDTTTDGVALCDSSKGDRPHTLVVQAVDDVGNVSCAAGGCADRTTVRLANADAPTVAITAPAAGATVSGVVDVRADINLTSVGKAPLAYAELLVDGHRIASSAASPFALRWDTLDPAAPAYDGPHTLTIRAVDSYGQATVRSIAVTTNNNGVRRFKATVAGSNVPAALVYDESLSTQAGAPVTVTVTNTSSLPWSAPAQTRAAAFWYRPGTSTVLERAGGAVLPDGNVLPGQSRTVTFTLRAPRLPTDVDASDLELRVDVEDIDPLQPDTNSTSSWAAAGNQPLSRRVAVTRAGQEKGQAASDKTPGQLGLEKYQHYVGEDLGAGAQHLVNVANGNGSVRLTPMLATGRGLNTVVDLTSNSREDTTRSPAGNAMSIALSGLVRLGEPLRGSPNLSSESQAGRDSVTFTDGDGTEHVFTGAERAGKRVWDEPPGVHLHLRKYSSTDATRRWAITRPDRTTFFFNADGWPTSVRDKNANELTFEYETPAPADDHAGPRPQLRRVRDAGGRAFHLNYYAKEMAVTAADGTSSTVQVDAKVRGRLREVIDHSGSALVFDYYDDGNLRRLSQRGYDRAPGSATDTPDTSSKRTSTAPRSWVFTYTNKTLSGPAETDPAVRRNPPQTAPRDSKNDPAQSTKPYSVVDPFGRETVLTYQGPDAASRGRVASVTDRAGTKTTFAYDPAARPAGGVTTVTAELAKPAGAAATTATSQYSYDDDGGRVTSILDPTARRTDIRWTLPPLSRAEPAAWHVARVSEPYADGTAASTAATNYTYDANGYLTSETDQLGNTTALTYNNPSAAVAGGDLDTTDADGARRLLSDGTQRPPHISELATKTSPEGVATTAVTDDYRYDFGYDPKGNLLTVAEPKVLTTDGGANAVRPQDTYTYRADGLVETHSDSRSNTTRYSYSAGLDGGAANGAPSTSTDPLNRITRFTYDLDGLVTAQTSPRGTGPTYTYDAFGRLKAQTEPKLQGQSTQLITSGADYDVNDNIVNEYQPGYRPLDPADRTSHRYDAMDRTITTTGPDTSSDPAGERTAYAYDAGGRLVRQVEPRGTATSGIADDFATDFTYDLLDRVTTVTRHQVSAAGAVLPASLWHRCYDLVGDLVRTTSPEAKLAAPQCTGDPSHTTLTTYDAAHRPVSERNPDKLVTSREYDRNDNVTRTVDGEGKDTRYSYDERDKLTETSQQFSPTVRLLHRKQYDREGNLTREISPRAITAAGTGPVEKFLSQHDYDSADQLVRTTLPSAEAPGSTADKQYLHRAYDANGWLTTSTQTTSSATLAGTPLSSQSKYTHYDTGWIRTSDDNLTVPDPSSGDPDPQVSYDYTAEGWTSNRTVAASGTGAGASPATTMTWNHLNDGQVAERTDEGKQKATYTYDPNDNLRKALEVGGAVEAGVMPREVQLDYDTLDRPTLTRERDQRLQGAAANFNTTTFGYDLNDNLTSRRENIEQTADGTTVAGKAGRAHTFTYSQADWVRGQTDQGPDSSSGVLTDDQRTLTTQDKVGRESVRVIQRRTGPDTWADKQRTNWTYNDNGTLARLTTTTGGTTTASTTSTSGVASTGGTTTEEHAVDYFDAGTYLNGHRVTDTYFRKASTATDGSTAKCTDPAARCVTRYRYDGRERVLEHDTGYGDKTTFDLDPAGNVLTQKRLTGTTVNETTVNTYSGDQLTTRKVDSDPLQRNHFDGRGNLDCTSLDTSTTQPSTRAVCVKATDGPRNPLVLADYKFDYLDRQERYEALQTDGTTSTSTDEASYTYDALDRVSREKEQHRNGSAMTSRTTAFDYIGLSGDISSEKHTAGTSDTPGAELTTKTYSYDAHGKRLSMSDKRPGASSSDDFTYGHDTQGSISQLLMSNGATPGAVKASYGYTTYGDEDTKLSRGDTNNTDKNPLNPYRYTGKRYDSGSKELDMGARRFAPDTGRFLQDDKYEDALDNLDLATDPLTSNRYSLAGGNPVSFVEVDGHAVAPERSGGASTSPTVTKTRAVPKVKAAASKRKKSRGSWWNGWAGAGMGLAKTADSISGAGGGRRGRVATALLGPKPQSLAAGLRKKQDQWGVDRDSRAYKRGNVGTQVGLAVAGASGLLRAGARGLAKAGAAGSRKLTRKGKESCDCFPAGTTIATAAGKKTIEQIQIGDQVWARDLVTGTSQLRRVTGLFQKPAALLLTITTTSAATGGLAQAETGPKQPTSTRIDVTPEHPFWVPGRGWTDAGQLRAGHQLMNRDGNPVRITSITSSAAAVTVYNFTVAGDHNYYITDAQLLVHNCTDPAPGATSSYRDITRGSSTRNVGTDTTHEEFADNLRQSGWSASPFRDGSEGTLFLKDGAKYSLRRKASSYAGWSADFTPAGARGKTLEIRLGYPR